STAETTSERLVGGESCAHKDGGCKANQSFTQHLLFSFPDHARGGWRPVHRSWPSSRPFQLGQSLRPSPPPKPTPGGRTAAPISGPHVRCVVYGVPIGGESNKKVPPALCAFGDMFGVAQVPAASPCGRQSNVGEPVSAESAYRAARRHDRPMILAIVL